VNVKSIQIFEGDVVHRHLLDGDPVLFNRQPSLHRMSMMCHRVRVLPYSTFRLNVSVTKPYNADFDGDEMNMHVPQSVEAATELREIAAVPKQMISPRLSKPLVSVVQDTLVGVNRLTRPTEFFTKRQYMSLLVNSKRWDGKVPPPAQPATETSPALWSGRQVVSALLPAVYLEMGNKVWDSGKRDDPENAKNYVVINNGEITQGILDGDIFDKALIHILYNDFSPDVTVDFIDSLQAVVAAYLQNSGFSVGLSDLVADSGTLATIGEEMETLKKKIESIQLQVHMGLFDNRSGRSNQEEFEGKVFETLDKVIGAAGKTGLKSLSANNRMVNMVKCGSKGADLNIAQMIALLGQQSIEGKRIAYGFQDRTLPHFKRYEDGAAARGFIESSFVKGLSPAEFFFHAMTGREGLIDTAVKSVTADTRIVIMEAGQTKTVRIGDWIDTHLAARESDVEYFPEEADLEMLQLNKPAFIPSVTPDGTIRWGTIAAVTRHDPGNQLYRVETLGGRSVIVTASKSLLIWDSEKKLFEQRNTPDVRPGDCMPVNMTLPEPPVITSAIDMANYLPKTEYLYGTDFSVAQNAIDTAMIDRERIPAGWWNENNGSSFTLPYENKGRFVRTLSRSNTSNIAPGFVYPFTTNRDGARIPDQFTLNAENGLFIGLFLAEGNVDVKSGYVGITNNSPEICQFVHDWFETLRITTHEETHINAIGGTTTSVRGYSTVLAKFLDKICGHGAANKHVPAEAFTAPLEFIKGLLNGYFSGDGTLTYNSIESGSASQELTEGITMLLSRLGVFAKVFKTQLKSNNLNTEVIQPTYRLSVRAQWATLLASQITFIDTAKETKRQSLTAAAQHRNFSIQNDVVLDEIVTIEPVSPDAYPKMYDLTVPETFTFGLANGLQVYDTADSGYMQRQLVKTMEDLIVHHDGTVRDAGGLLVQFAYGDDGTSATKIENQPIGLGKMSDAEIREKFAVQDVGGEKSQAFITKVIEDRDILIKNVWGGRIEKVVQSAVHLPRLIANAVQQIGVSKDASVSGAHVLETIDRIIAKTRPDNRLWAALLRYHLNPNEIKGLGLTTTAFDWLAEQIVIKHMKSWVAPGEMAGVIAAQSLGEPTTQMTLNTFHLAGVAAKSGMTRGVPRLKELLKVTQNPKATSLTIYLRPDLMKSKEEARRLTQELEFTMLKDLVTVSRIYFDPRDSASLIAEDTEWLTFFTAFEQSAGVESTSPWILRLELDRERMFNKNITIEDVNFVLRKQFEGTLETAYSDHNASNIVLRIRMKFAQDPLDDLTSIKTMQNKVLTSVLIRGLPGLKSVSFRKITNEVYAKDEAQGRFEAVEQFVLDTLGTNFLDVLIHPDVDGLRLISNHVHDIYENLGIEAARMILFREIFGLFEQAAPVNYRHVALLVDAICCRGRMMSADRYGVNKGKSGPLVKASFEQVEEIMLRAALFGEMDPVTGASANIMMGQPIRGGTSFSQILLDEAALANFITTAPPPKKLERVGVLQDLKESANKGCKIEDLRVPAALPPMEATSGEVDLPDMEMNFVDEQ
jgi:DNA-directed RNA polymerase beta' subunit/intein/homing endonuclease